jgi:hypothetical protein
LTVGCFLTVAKPLAALESLLEILAHAERNLCPSSDYFRSAATFFSRYSRVQNPTISIRNLRVGSARCRSRKSGKVPSATGNRDEFDRTDLRVFCSP